MKKLQNPKWHKELDVYRSFRTTFIVEGNVNDTQQWIDEGGDSFSTMSLEQYLEFYLKGNCGYEYVIFYNRIDGFYALKTTDMDKEITEIIGCNVSNTKNMTLNDAATIIRKIIANKKTSCAVIFNYASLMLTNASNLSDAELEILGKLFLTSAESQEVNKKRNLLFFVVNKVNDIPAWFYLNNPYVKTLHISKPSKELRMRVMYLERNRFFDYQAVSSDELSLIMDGFGNLTEGFSNIELNGFLTLCEQKQISIRKIKEAINIYKYGEAESKWDEISLEKIKDVENALSKRVMGQSNAIQMVSDVLRRAKSGMSNLQTNSIGHPKGVMFFAGPTGTGKTELAKAVAEFIFGDENSMIRFDMSEYSQEHSDQRLIGPPPGYVGYENGGQLTNAVKENPFSVLLFDEIDKAAPRILDKFLQILEDGRITDSSGETVYFSECLIIFTSNIGVGKSTTLNINEQSVYHQILPSMEYDEIENKLYQNVEIFFKSIERPEIFNRLSNNVVVFDYIREEAAKEIFNAKVKNIIGKIREEKGIQVVLNDYKDVLFECAFDNLEYGGRGIVNMLEKMLINPLARIIVDEGMISGDIIDIKKGGNSGLEYCVRKCHI